MISTLIIIACLHTLPYVVRHVRYEHDAYNNNYCMPTHTAQTCSKLLHNVTHQLNYHSKFAMVQSNS